MAAYPNEGWAEAVFGEPDVERLWDAVARAVRLDEPDPIEAWRRHVDRLTERAHLLTDSPGRGSTPTSTASAGPPAPD